MKSGRLRGSLYVFAGNRSLLRDKFKDSRLARDKFKDSRLSRDKLRPQRQISPRTEILHRPQASDSSLGEKECYATDCIAEDAAAAMQG